MPGMDGVEPLHAAKELPNAEGTPFLILTADAVSGMREQFLKEGFDDYLPKPLDGEKPEWTLMRYLPADKPLSVHAPADEKKRRASPGFAVPTKASWRSTTGLPKPPGR